MTDHSDGGVSEGTLAAGLEDYVLPFHLEKAGVRGRLVRLGPVLDELLSRHDYPEAVSKLLGEATLLTVMLGASLKFEGRLTLQTSSNGPMSLVVVQFRAPGSVRAYASFDKEGVAEAVEAATPEQPRLFGAGHMAMTIEPGGSAERYQGFVELEGENVVDAAYTYFRQSEQIPTFLHVVVARAYKSGKEDEAGGWSWRAGGLMMQKLGAPGHQGSLARTKTDGELDDENWNRARVLAETVEDHELLDPMLSPERLLFRLFHEEQVRAFRAQDVSAFCQCSRERVEQMLKRFSAEKLGAMAEDGEIVVTCQFCNRVYHFPLEDLFAHIRS